MNRTLILTALLVSQMPDLDQEFRLTRAGSPQGLVTIIAQYPDGRPARGTISCSGWWRKFQEGAEDYALSMPFVTDSRGAIGMNPSLDDGWMLCWSEKDGLTGRVTVTFSTEKPTGVYYIVLGKES